MPTRVAPIVAGVLLLAGCAEDSRPADAADPGMGLATPERLLQSRAVDRATLRPEVRLSTGQSVTMRRVDDALWSGTVRVQPGIQVDVEITWISAYAGTDLPLATLTRQRFAVGADGAALSVSAGEYVYDFDYDNDGVSNLGELEQGRDPLVSGAGDPQSGDGGTNGGTTAGDGVAGTDTPSVGTPTVPDDQPPQPDDTDTTIDAGQGGEDGDSSQIPAPSVVAVDVYVPRVASSRTPKIDGKKVEIDDDGRFSGEWADAVQVDSSGVPLGINNLMIDQGTGATSGTPHRAWAAMHDGTWLYVVVMVEDDGYRFGDSPRFWQDDGIEIFVDGDFGRASSYGDDDDYHLIVPLLEPGTNRSPNSNKKAGFEFGPNSSTGPIELQFTTGPGIGPDGIARPRYERDVYEFRIELDSIGVQTGKPFGFELQVNDDDDGDTRDAKWGWAHPARTSEDVDFTYLDPSYMGTVLLD